MEVIMTRDEFKSLWLRESGDQPGMILDVVPVNFNAANDQKVA